MGEDDRLGTKAKAEYLDLDAITIDDTARITVKLNDRERFLKLSEDGGVITLFSMSLRYGLIQSPVAHDKGRNGRELQA